MNRALLTCILPLALCGCARSADAVGRAADTEEVARVASPDSVVDAVLTRTNTMRRRISSTASTSFPGESA